MSPALLVSRKAMFNKGLHNKVIIEIFYLFISAKVNTIISSNLSLCPLKKYNLLLYAKLPQKVKTNPIYIINFILS